MFSDPSTIFLVQYVGGIQLYVVRAVELGPCNRGYDTPSSEWREEGDEWGEGEKELGKTFWNGERWGEERMYGWGLGSRKGDSELLQG